MCNVFMYSFICIMPLRFAGAFRKLVTNHFAETQVRFNLLVVTASLRLVGFGCLYCVKLFVSSYCAVCFVLH